VAEVSGKTLAIAGSMVTIVVVGAGMLALFGGGPPPAPERPKPPPPPEALMNGELRYSPVVYRAQIEQDARRYGVPVPGPGEIEAPFFYLEEQSERRKLTPKAPIETQHVRLALDIEKRDASLEGQRYRSETLVMRIENRTAKYLAYRIETDLPDSRKCTAKGDIPHNALVLAPHQILRRSECLYRGQATLDVVRIEVMELPPLPAVYVGRLPAIGALYEKRTSAGHVPDKGTLCPQTFSWREIRDGIDRKEFGWRDVIDFYARHSCDEFAFFRTYRFRTDPSAPLPARPEG
jgi:hypothetical protein